MAWGFWIADWKEELRGEGLGAAEGLVGSG